MSSAFGMSAGSSSTLRLRRGVVAVGAALIIGLAVSAVLEQSVHAGVRTVLLLLLSTLLLAALVRQLARADARERSLGDLEEQWRAAFASNPTMYFIVDAQGTVLSVNAFGAEQLGYEPDELIGRPVLDIFLAADRDPVRRNAEACFENLGRRSRWEARKVRKDGTMLWVRETANAVLLKNQPVLLVVCEDITERKKAEQAQRQSEQELRDLIETIPAMAWTTLPDGSKVFASKGWTDYTGLPAQAPPGSACKAALHPDDIDRYMTRWQESLASGEPFESEARVRRAADGEYRWFLARAVSLRDEAGKVLRWYGIATDIEDRKRAELTGLLMFRSLQDSERKLEEAQRMAHVGYWESEFETGRLTLSDETCRIVGLQAHELPQWQGRFQELIHPDDRSRVMEALATAAEEEPETDLEYRVVRPDGEVRTVLARRQVKHGEAGRPQRQFGMVQDITALRRAEEERRDSEIRFRTLMDFAADAFFLCEDGILLDVNSQACVSLGYRRDELIGMNAADFDADADLDFYRRVHAGLGAAEIVTFETRHRRKDGTLLPVEVRMRAFMQGQRRLFVSLARDISEHKKAEASHARLEDELRRSQKMEAVGTLAGGIAHDFNNILGAIVGYGELAQWKMSEGRPIADELEEVMQAGQRGKRLVEHILAFSRSGAGARVPVRVQSVVEEVLALVAASLAQGIRLERRLGAGNASVTGDATQIHQVAMNLCTNAVQAMSCGGVLSVALDRIDVAQRRTLSHGVLEPRSYVQLVVSDTGTGIQDAALERIFDPFFTTKGVGKGTGLGLSLVHGIVTEYHGGIDVTTREGAGTTFTVWLPCSGETSIAPAEDIAEVPVGNGESVMIVDDEGPLVRLAEETLAQLAYDPSGFDSSLAALEAFRAEPQRYDLVLTDVTMPDLTGTDLAREIRRLRPDVPIVLMSGYKGPQLTALAHAAGVRDILHKPLARRDLARALARALAREVEQGTG